MLVSEGVIRFAVADMLSSHGRAVLRLFCVFPYKTSPNSSCGSELEKSSLTSLEIADYLQIARRSSPRQRWFFQRFESTISIRKCLRTNTVTDPVRMVAAGFLDGRFGVSGTPPSGKPLRALRSERQNFSDEDAGDHWVLRPD